MFKVPLSAKVPRKGWQLVPKDAKELVHCDPFWDNLSKLLPTKRDGLEVKKEGVVLEAPLQR